MFRQTFEDFTRCKNIVTVIYCDIWPVLRHFLLPNFCIYCLNGLKSSEKVLVFEFHQLCENSYQWIMYAVMALFQREYFRIKLFNQEVTDQRWLPNFREIQRKATPQNVLKVCLLRKCRILLLRCSIITAILFFTGKSCKCHKFKFN